MWRLVHRAAWKSTQGVCVSPPALLPVMSTCSFRQASTTSSTKSHSNKYGTILGSLAGVASLATAIHYYSSTNRIYCRHGSTVQQSDHPTSTLPPVTLYEYPSCPFCGKVRAFLDYHSITYTAVIVNPVSREEIKFSTSKKLPLVVVDGEKIQDSSLVVSVLKTCLERGLSVSESLKCYPLMNITTAKGKETTEHGNIYFVMYGEQNTERSVGELREEREWRQWVDDELVHTLPPNIYRTLSEARQTMVLISGKSSMTSFQRFLARTIAPVGLYFIGKRSIKKYNLKPDARESLYHCCNQWIEAIGNDRQFMGGTTPNLADLAVYGAISATEGLQTFRDIQTHTRLGPWYSSMREFVNGPNDIPQS